MALRRTASRRRPRRSSSRRRRTFTFQVRAPSAPGLYAIHLRPVIDAVTWMEDQGVFLTSPSTSAGCLLPLRQRCAREQHLELFFALWERRSRRRRIRRDVEVLARDEAWTDILAAERTRDLVARLTSIHRDPSSLVDPLHAASLGACSRSPEGSNKIATETKTLKVGDVAPDFALARARWTRDQALGFRGQRVVLAFFPFAFSNT